jgi:Fe-S oxidoreductase
MGPLAITLLMLAGCTAFGILASRKLALLTRLQPEPRTDAPLARLKSVLVNGFLQRRMVQREGAAGLMHTVIFLGFTVLLVRKLQLLAVGYSEFFVWPGWPGALFAALKDAVELAVLAAVAYALWRRFVVKPRRLEANGEALLVLGLIAVIMVTDLVFDGARFALFAAGSGGAGDPGLVHERGYAFVGSALASAFEPMSAGALLATYHASYWVQMGTVFAFLAILPLGEHFHICTALPALYFRRGAPAHTVPAVDLERMMADDADPVTLRVGARTARDLSWKDGLDVFTCTECGRCKDACPTFLTGKPLAMKWVNDSLKHHLVEQRERLLTPLPPPSPGGSSAAPAAGPAAAEAEDPLPALIGPVIGEDTLWACTTCGYCEAACPIELEHLPRLFKLRQHQVMMAGEFPHGLKPVFEAWESQSNPWGLPQQQRADWARDLDVPRWTEAAQAADFDVLFYVGSAASYDPRGQKIARAFVQVLRATGTRFAILGEAETSTGECARRAGNEMLFQTLAASLVQTLNGLGVKRIVSCDPHAFNSLVNEYPAFGGHWQVEHHSQFIARALRDGRLRLARGAPGAARRVVFHDPCYLGRHNDEYAAPRRVLQAVCADAPLEFALHGPKAMCCGAGGARMWLEETIGERINVLRTKQALEQQPAVIATACPYCAVMLGDGLKALGRDDVAQLDIAELVAAALPAAHSATTSPSPAPATAIARRPAHETSATRADA